MDKMHVLMVVKKPLVATFLSQQMPHAYVCSFGMSVMGTAFDAIVVLDPVDGDSQRETDQIKNWVETVVKPSLRQGGIYIEVFRREAPPQIIPPDRQAVATPGVDDGDAAAVGPSE